jgi:hypothetical protein
VIISKKTGTGMTHPPTNRNELEKNRKNRKTRRADLCGHNGSSNPATPAGSIERPTQNQSWNKKVIFSLFLLKPISPLCTVADPGDEPSWALRC